MQTPFPNDAEALFPLPDDAGEPFALDLSESTEWDARLAAADTAYLAAAGQGAAPIPQVPPRNAPRGPRQPRTAANNVKKAVLFSLAIKSACTSPPSGPPGRRRRRQKPGSE